MKNEIITENKQAGRSVGEGSLRKLFRALFAEATNWAIITPTVKFIRSLRYAQRSLLHSFRETEKLSRLLERFPRERPRVVLQFGNSHRHLIQIKLKFPDEI